MQDTLEQGLSTVLRVPVALTVAGRTDAGVHATGQVAHCDVPREAWEQQRDRLVRRLRGVLPADVAVRDVEEAHPDFDARFAALRRHYVYRLTDAPWGPSPLRRTDVVGWPRTLDVAAMDAAAGRLLGEHDFAAFCRRREGATTIRTLLQLSVRRDPDDVICIDASADAFCHSMVRSLVGALLAVGEGRRPVEWPATLLSRDGAGQRGAGRPGRRADPGRGGLPPRPRSGRAGAGHPGAARLITRPVPPRSVSGR